MPIPRSSRQQHLTPNGVTILILDSSQMSGTKTGTNDNDIRLSRYNWRLKLSDVREVISDKRAAESLNFCCETAQVYACVDSHGWNRDFMSCASWAHRRNYPLSNVQPCLMPGGRSLLGRYRN